ncbi:MAG: NAD(P)/FAD-dependent oxidoreductase [Candidatus Solibacter sp.]
MTVDAIVVGAGAAGLMCAIEAGRRGRRIVVLEHGPRAGRKILISGGGRCNFTNLHTTAANFLSRNPHFAKSALARYTPRDFIDLVERHDIPYHEKTLGQLFCDRTAADILRMLESECDSAGVRLATGCTVTRIAPCIAPGFRVETSRDTWQAPALVIASGGLSIPKMGATPFGYAIARQFGLPIVECSPALVPFTFSAADRQRFDGLAGVAAAVIAAATATARQPFRESLLFTHRGLSGPAILQASSYWRHGETVEIDLLPGLDFAAELADARAAGARAEARTLLARNLPKRLADRWCELHAAAKPVATWSDREIAAFTETLHHWRFQPAGTEGYEKAEVTSGGVDTAGLSSQTMEARKVPGLYFIGEVVDVTGHLGGFNFQWAWASGAAAGRAL